MTAPPRIEGGTQDVLHGQFGRSADPAADPTTKTEQVREQLMSSSAMAGALAGLKVIDLSRVLGGPYCAQMLADHGADVIKVEPPLGDETRGWGPPFDADGISAYFAGINRNKRTLALDLTKPGGRDVLLKLLEDTDVLIENFKTGTMEKWNLGYEEVLARRFPKLIHARVTGFGADGPMGGFPGYDAMVQAWAGLVSVNGAPDSGPVRLGVPVVDLSTGMNACMGILMALYERGRSGKGQFVDATLFDSAVALHQPHAPNYFMAGLKPKLHGNSHGNLAPYDNFPTRGRNIVIGAGNDAQFRKLTQLLGKPELADDPRFRTNRDRIANKPALRAELAALTADRDGEAFATELMKNGVPSGAVFEVPDVMEHPHTRHRGMVWEKDGYRNVGNPVKLSRTPASVRSKPKAFGQDTRAILKEHGFADADIEAMIQDGVAMVEPRKA
jgi:formyl-CoA transferase